MKVAEFIKMCTEPEKLNTIIYNMHNGSLYPYVGNEIQKSQYLYCEVCSFDAPWKKGIIILNINKEE